MSLSKSIIIYVQNPGNSVTFHWISVLCFRLLILCCWYLPQCYFWSYLAVFPIMCAEIWKGCLFQLKKSKWNITMNVSNNIISGGQKGMHEAFLWHLLAHFYNGVLMVTLWNTSFGPERHYIYSVLFNQQPPTESHGGNVRNNV